MTGLEAAVVIAAGGLVYAAARTAEAQRSPVKASSRGRRAGRIPERSRLVIKYSGTKPGDAPRKHSARRPTRRSRSVVAISTACKRAGTWSTRRTATRWDRRRADRPAETVLDKWRTVRATATKETPFQAWLKATLQQLGKRLSLLSPQVAKPAPRGTPPEPPPREDPEPAAVPRPRDEPRTPAGGPEMTTPTVPDMAPDATRPAAPPDWAALIDRVREFQPDNDVELIEWMKAEASGVVAYAEALEGARENCVSDVGLDPSSVAGITTYSEHMSDASDRMSEALTTFLTVYREVLNLAAEGVVLPHNGRWMTGGTVS